MKAIIFIIIFSLSLHAYAQIGYKYSLHVDTVKAVLDAKLKDRKFNEDQFHFYHLHRNYFNVKDEVKTLEWIGKRKYKDNLGNIWEEKATMFNYYHMPKLNWLFSMIGIARPYSRKFHRSDETTGLNGVFELVIRHDGKRIDGFIHDSFQETYNYAPAGNTNQHKILDVAPHTKSANYSFKMNLGYINIID